MIKYVLYPGYVKAKDNDWHFIGVKALAALYGVRTNECVVIFDEVDEQQYGRMYNLDELQALRPREDGNYKFV